MNSFGSLKSVFRQNLIHLPLGDGYHPDEMFLNPILHLVLDDLDGKLKSSAQNVDRGLVPGAKESIKCGKGLTQLVNIFRRKRHGDPR